MLPGKQQAKSWTPASERVRLGEGTVEVQIPADAKRSKLKTDRGEITYLRFKHGMWGNFVPCYVHAEEQELPEVGSVIRATFGIFIRTHEDGSTQMHVDFRPTQEQPAHQLLFLNKMDLRHCNESWPRYETPQVKNGFVVIAPFGTTPKKMDSDPQLSRLLDAGWSIKEDHGATVDLVRPTNKGEDDDASPAKEKVTAQRCEPFDDSSRRRALCINANARGKQLRRDHRAWQPQPQS